MERMERVDDRHSAQGAHVRGAARTWPRRHAFAHGGTSVAAGAPVRLLLAAVLVSVVAGAWCASALAFSQRGHEFGFPFATKVEKAEAEKGEAAVGRLSGPAGIAVSDSTGDVYVVDAGDQRIARFHPEGESETAETGNPISVWGFGVVDGKAELETCTTNPCKPGLAGTGAGQLDYPGKPKGHQRTAMAITVDNSTNGADASKGDVYVVANTVSEQNVVDKFSASGAFLGALPIVAPTVGGVSVDASGVVWVQAATFVNTEETPALVALETVERFNGEASNKLISTATLAPNEIQEGAVLEAHCPSPGIAIDGAGGTLYLNHEPFQIEVEPGESCFPEEELFNKEEKTKLKGVETSVTAKTQVVSETEFKPTSVELERLNTTGIAVDQASETPGGDVYLNNQGSIAAFDASGAFIQRFGVQQLKAGGGAGLAVDGSTHDVYAVDFKKDRVDVFEPEAAGAPIIDSLSAQNLEVGKTELKASIDPHGEAVEYFFEYGTEPCPAAKCTRTPAKPLPAGFGDVAVSEPVSGLEPGTTYFFRVEAENVKKHEVASSGGELHSFTTLPSAVEALPDHRAWELVSPPQKRGASVEPIGGLGGPNPTLPPIIQAAENGEAITYGVNIPPEAEPEGNRAPEAQQIISKRTPGGWESKDIVTPSVKPKALPAGDPEEYQLFSLKTLAFGLVLPPGLFGAQEPPLVHELGGKPVTEEQRGIYRRHNFDVEGCEVAPKSCFEPLVTPANAPVTPNFGGQLLLLGATPDLEHVVLRSHVPLVAGGPEPTEKAKIGDLYEWNAGSPPSEPLKIVSVLPNKEVHSEEEEEPGLGIEAIKQFADARNAISSDGKHVIWSSLKAKHLYTRNMETGQTLDVSLPEAGVEQIEGGQYSLPVYQTASTDGKRIFFTDQVPLTHSSTLDPHNAEEERELNGAGNPGDLYVCELVEEEGKQACKLTDLTAGAHAELGESADVTQNMPGASEDGTHVYFVANGALAPGAVKGSCPTQHQRLALIEEKCNLYEEHFNKGTWESPKLVAVLSSDDGPDWGAVHDPESIAYLSSRVSPNGQFLAFMSKRPLTGTNNEDAVVEGTRDQQVYLYDAAHERLTCASCNPKGERPHGVSDVETTSEGLGLLADRTQAWLGQTLAGSIPTWTATTQAQVLYQSRYLNNEGRLFFNSPDQLTTLLKGQTYDFKENVYEYEPAGVGTCENPSGCVALISSGTDEHESAFLDATPDGKNVFFVTAAQLVRADSDHNYDVYDARVCSEAEPCIESEGLVNPPPCESTHECRPGELTLKHFEFTGPSGTGNHPTTIVRPGPGESKGGKKGHTPLENALKKCHKLKKHKKRAACERAARKRYKAKKARHGHGARR